MVIMASSGRRDLPGPAGYSQDLHGVPHMNRMLSQRESEEDSFESVMIHMFTMNNSITFYYQLCCHDSLHHSGSSD